MTEQFLDNLKHIHPEPVPATLWPNIQRAIARKRLQLAPVWMRIAAAMIVLALLGEVISSIREKRQSSNGNPYGTIFKPNNQWYND